MLSASAMLAACSGSDPQPNVVNEPMVTAQATAAPPPSEEVGAVASAPPLAASATASAAPAKPTSQGRCPAGMAEFGGGKFKSTYYKVELAVEPFCMDVNLTSTDEYTACVASGKCDKFAVHACDPSTFEKEGRGKLPMICVDFNQAERYCKAQDKRLVSDLEWEWAARGGDEARAYPWGNDAPAEQLCWSGKEKRTMPCPIGTYEQGKPGVFDLAGNIYQWTTTTNDKTGSFRVGRGGSWKDGTAKQVAIANVGAFKVTYRCGFLGIRCATAVP
jgi:sulfatase modifying factor 1